MSDRNGAIGGKVFGSSRDRVGVRSCCRRERGIPKAGGDRTKYNVLDEIWILVLE